MYDDNDAPPPARSAHSKPSRRNSSTQLGSHALPTPQRHRPIDPRFDPMFGNADLSQFKNNYKFLQEQIEEEETRRQHRIRCLKCILRRFTLEDAGEDLAEYDLSEDERMIFGEDQLQELNHLKLTPSERIHAELDKLKRESQLYKSKTKGNAAVSRKAQIKKGLMRKEVQAVKMGTKLKPYFPKRSVVKKAIHADTFESLEQKGGKHAVERYLARKSKKQH
ncbi:unnamed protein product [Phytomonas sp. Hart1]|nr:unnamed protein product [Phytomonas sp. Hart1]|eukprot:CCW67526.1 unnamed protein product [Phytomonas sp. isolate Hart1]